MNMITPHRAAAALMLVAGSATAQVDGPFDYLRIDGLGREGPNALVTDLSNSTADFLNRSYMHLMRGRSESTLLGDDGDSLDRLFSLEEAPATGFVDQSPEAPKPRSGTSMFGERTLGGQSLKSRPFSFLSSGSGDHVTQLRDRPSSGSVVIPRISLEVGPAPPSGLVGAYSEAPLDR